MKYKVLYKPTAFCDGSHISIQASRTHYCKPRENEGPYSHVECGFPTTPPRTKEFESFADDIDRLTETVYSYVPVDVLMREAIARGGFVEPIKIPLTGGYKSHSTLWVDLDPYVVEEYKQWARDNFDPKQALNPSWHPVVQEEWASILVAQSKHS